MPLPLDEHFGKLLEMEKLDKHMVDYEISIKNLDEKAFKKDILKRYRELDEETLETIISMFKGQAERFFTLCRDSSCDTILGDWMELCPNSLDHAGWKEEGLLDAVLEKMLRKSYQDIIPHWFFQCANGTFFIAQVNLCSYLQIPQILFILSTNSIHHQ